MKITTKLWIALAVLIMLSPIGLILPEYFKAGSAWGEWGADEMKELVGYVPIGLKKIAGVWNAPFPDYSLKVCGDSGLAGLSFAYIISAVLGMGVTVLSVIGIGNILTKKSE